MPATPSQSSIHWKLGLGLLVSIILTCTVLSFFLAFRRVGRVVDTDYYQHGLHYGETAAKNPGGNWTMSASLAGNDLRVKVADRSGTPVSGGKVVFEAAPTREAAASPLQLAESAPGTFHCPRPTSPHGELRGTLRFTRGEASASQKLVLID